MNSLNIRKYCVIGLGNVSGMNKLLSSISETDVTYVSGSGLIIATFQSAFHLSEIEILFNQEEKSYIIFEMTPGFFSANIKDKKFQDTLFGGPIDNSEFPKNISTILDTLKNMKFEFREINDVEMEKFIKFDKNEEDDIEEPDVDDILDKISKIGGYEKLSKKEKDLLNKYSQGK